MWYTAKCLRECVFRGVRRLPGQMYEGPVKPLAHFEIISEKPNYESREERVHSCPVCGCDVSKDFLAWFDRYTEPQNQGKTLGQLRRMQFHKLIEYGVSIGAEIDGMDDKIDVIAAIQARERALSKNGAEKEEDE